MCFLASVVEISVWANAADAQETTSERTRGCTRSIDNPNKLAPPQKRVWDQIGLVSSVMVPQYSLSAWPQPVPNTDYRLTTLVHPLTRSAFASASDAVGILV